MPLTEAELREALGHVQRALDSKRAERDRATDEAVAKRDRDPSSSRVRAKLRREVARLEAKAKSLQRRIDELTDRAGELRDDIKAAIRERDHELRESYQAVGFDGCPVSPIVYAVLLDLRGDGVVFTVISGDRREGVAEKFGKSSQAYLYAHQNDPGFNPANPPNSSTHEYVNGGNGGTPAYPASQFAVGAKLPPWALGLDIASNAQASYLVAEARKRGYDFFQPYQSGSELHHVCIRTNPIDNLKRRTR